MNYELTSDTSRGENYLFIDIAGDEVELEFNVVEHYHETETEINLITSEHAEIIMDTAENTLSVLGEPVVRVNVSEEFVAEVVDGLDAVPKWRP